jgi:hypothetical protein
MEELKRYRIVIAAVVLLAMGGVTWWAVTKNSGETPESAEELPELPEVEQDEITEVQITRPEDDAPVTLTKDGDNWRITAPIEGPAARTHVDSLLEKLSGLTVEGIAGRTARHHERFEIDAEHGIHVIARAGEREVIDLWIGGFSEGNTLVRLDGHDEVLMVSGSIKSSFNRDANDWRDRTITDLEASAAREITFTSTNGTFHFSKNGENWEHVREPAAEGEEPPAEIENFDQAKVGSIVTRIARLRAADFAGTDATVESAGLGEGASRVTLITGEGENAVTTVLLIGNEATAGQRYVMREGGDGAIFVVSSADAGRLMPNTEAFQTVPGAEGEGEEPPVPEGMPPGGMPGGGQIPPELLQQIQEQMRQQGGHP